MASEIERIVGEYETPHLLEQYYRRRAEYEQDALEAMEREIERRGLTQEQIALYREPEEQVVEDSGEPPEFVPFDHSFSQTDILLANAILKDVGIPYYMDNPLSSVLPLDNPADHRFTIHVLASRADEAHELFDQHFHREEGQYRLRHTSAKDRLRAFSFFEMRLTEAQMEEQITVTFSSEERSAIAAYCRRLIDEVDAVEKAQERTVFHYDNLEAVIKFLGRDGAATATLQDLVTVLEALQIYCDEEGFPDSLLPAAEALLGVFE
jgi:hypothetical protein